MHKRPECAELAHAIGKASDGIGVGNIAADTLDALDVRRIEVDGEEMVGVVAQAVDTCPAHPVSRPGDDGDAHAAGVSSRWRFVRPRNR